MKNKRRDFLKLSGISSLGVAGSALFPGSSFGADESKGYEQIKKLAHKQHKQVFNMSGYAAPKIETVRIGVIGLGSRGSAAVRRLSKIDGVDIKALCDLRPKQAEQAKEKLSEYPHSSLCHGNRQTCCSGSSGSNHHGGVLGLGGNF